MAVGLILLRWARGAIGVRVLAGEDEKQSELRRGGVKDLERG